jgi:RNA polymerase sigma-70 factor (family 1)
VIKENSYDEGKILMELSRGVESAFEKVYHAYSSCLYYKLLKLVKSHVVAQEILQEVFLVIWNKRKSIDVEKSFRSYLFSIAANKCYDFFRKAARDRKMHAQLLRLSQKHHNQTEEDIITKETSGILHHVIELLPPRRRLIFLLCKVDGRSYDEVSRQLGISPSTISDHIVKANNFIRDHLLKTVIE